MLWLCYMMWKIDVIILFGLLYNLCMELVQWRNLIWYDLGSFGLSYRDLVCWGLRFGIKINVLKFMFYGSNSLLYVRYEWICVCFMKNNWIGWILMEKCIKPVADPGQKSGFGENFKNSYLLIRKSVWVPFRSARKLILCIFL